MSRKKLIAIIAACVVVVIVVVVITTQHAPMYTLSVSVSPSGAGSVSPSSGEYEYGSQVTLTASAATGFRFVNWAGNVETVANTSAPSTTISVTGNYAVVANFTHMYFLDPNLETAIREAIGKPTGDIYPSDLTGAYGT